MNVTGWLNQLATPIKLAPNDRLGGVEWLGRGEALGPEATAIDAAGRVHTGTRDGRVLRLDPAIGGFATLADTGGRPLGMVFDPAGTLYLCDASRGLLALSPQGALRTLATEQGGVRFGFADGIERGPDGTLYFSDASARSGSARTSSSPAGAAACSPTTRSPERSSCCSPACSSPTALRWRATAPTCCSTRPERTG
jgi:sugar lactone lactonase YvrE